jgi:hypothetical protein
VTRTQLAVVLLVVVVAGVVGGALVSWGTGHPAQAQLGNYSRAGTYELTVLTRTGQTARLLLLNTCTGEVWDYNWGVGPDVKWRKFPDHQTAVRGAAETPAP